MTKYIEINGTRYDLDDDGYARVPGNYHLHAGLIRALGLEIKEDAPKWTIVNQAGAVLTHAAAFGASQDVPEGYRTGLELLATYAGHYHLETFELLKDGVVVATLKGENA